MTQDSIRRIRAAQGPQRRLYTKRQVKPLSQDGILKPRDANRSIKQRKEKEKVADEKKLDKKIERVYGIKPTSAPRRVCRGQLIIEMRQRREDSSSSSITSVFLLD
jgi:hypothetical protein